MTTETTPTLCPAKECRRPATLQGERYICEAKHGWNASAVALQCPRCRARCRQVEVKDDLLACIACAKTWNLAQVSATDHIAVGMVDGGPACDRIMRAVDALTAELLGDDDDAQAIREAFPPGWLARAITHKETTLAEVVARFRRNLIAGGVPKK